MDGDITDLVPSPKGLALNYFQRVPRPWWSKTFK